MSIITRTEISFFMYNTHAWFRIDRNHRNILFVVVFIHFELRFYVLERYFRTHFEILDHFVSKSNLTYSVNYYDIFSDLTLSVYFTEYYWILKFTEFTEYLVVSTEYLNLDRPCTSVSKFYFTVTQCHVKVSGNPPTILGNFQESSGNFPGTFPTTPLPIPTHSTPLPPDPPTYPPILFPTPKHFKLIFSKLLFRYHFGRISHFPTPFISLLQKPRSLNL